MRKLLRASLLSLTLSCVAHAGHIPNDGKVTPTPTPATSSDSQVPSDSDGQNLQSTESIVTEIALTVLQSVLSLF